MEKNNSNDIVFCVKVASDEETKKKNKKNINYNNFQKSYQKNHHKNFFVKNQKTEIKTAEKNKINKKKSGQINDDSSPTKETINSPSNNKKISKINTSQKKNEKEEINDNIKLEKKESLPKNNNKEKISKFNTFESAGKNENEDDLVTSFERKPSELKSPHTISEDSFTSSYEEEKSNYDKKKSDKKNNENNEKIEGDKKKEKIKSDSYNSQNSNTYSELVENELIYVDKIKYNNDEDEDLDKIELNKKGANNYNKIENNKNNQINNNIKIPELDLKEKNIKEKEIKERERDKKKEKFKNIEIKTKITTRQTTYINSNNKILVNKSPREFIMKTEREGSTSNINNIVNISSKNLEEKKAYIPVNQRQKLIVNKKQIDSYKIRDSTKANSINFNEINIPNIEMNKKKEKEKENLYLSNFKNKSKKFLGVSKTNTEEKNRYRIKYINGNYLKDNFYNTNMNKINLENKYNKVCISNRKQKYPKNDLENKIFKNLSHTIEIPEDYNHEKRRNKIKDKYNNNNNEKNKNDNEDFYPKKNTVLLTKSANNKLGLNINDLKSNKIYTNHQLNNNNISKKFSCHSNSNKIIYEPKKLGVIRVRSTEKANNTPIYSNMSYDPNQHFNYKIKEGFHSGNNYKYNNLNNTLNGINNNIINIEDTLFKKNSDNIQKKMIELNNSFAGIDQKSQSYNTMLNNFNNINNFSSIINYNYEIGKIDNLINNNNSLISNKMKDKTNSASNLINLLNQNEKKSLNDKTIQNNNLVLGNLYQNLLFHHNSSYDICQNEQLKNLNNKNQLFNLLGNNFISQNNVQNNLYNNLNNSIGNINNFNLQNLLSNNYNNIEQNTSLSINFEDLIILLEYIKEIIIALNKNKIIENECFEFWNYYYNSSICCQLEKLFTNPLDSNAIRISINYTLMSIMLCYDYSFENDLLNKAYSTLSDILKLNYKNLILICEHILSKITKEGLSNIWVLKLNAIVNSFNYNDYNQFLFSGYNMTIVERISYNTNIIVQNLRFLLKNFKSEKNDILTSIFKKIREKTYEEINTFFRENILRITNLNGSILGSVFLLKNNNFRTLPAPYVRTKNNKEFSLVLDLDETLINFKPKNNGEEGGVLRVRPGITEFLDEVGKYYELIIFTTATQDYADALIDAVEEDKIYFDHRLYREHAIIIDNDFIKDLTRIGRPLDKIIIVDNMPQNFRLQKENGIIIKAFWGEDNLDTALYDLYPILVNIAKEGGDVRKSLVKYKEEIVKNVTSCISKNNL